MSNHDLGVEGLRWATAQVLPGHAAYEGTAGVLRALCEARLAGVTEFDLIAASYRDALAAEPLEPRGTEWPREIIGVPEDTSLYVGAAGRAAALRCWGEVAADATATEAAARVAVQVASAELSPVRDIVLGDAGVLCELVAAQQTDGVIRYAEDLVASGEASGAGTDWRMAPGVPHVMPNFSHGTAGVAFALSRAARALDRPDLLKAATSGAERLVELGQRPDGTLAVPHSVPDAGHPQAWGWCHGPTGTVQLFLELAQDDPTWQSAVDASLAALRGSGIPERKHPGFWDNNGQCCGTAGVGELALDRYQATGDASWLGWAKELADDLVSRAVPQDIGVAWFNVEHTADPPELPPEPGFMQGTSGIAAFLLRLARVEAEGRSARRVPWPDRV